MKKNKKKTEPKKDIIYYIDKINGIHITLILLACGFILMTFRYTYVYPTLRKYGVYTKGVVYARGSKTGALKYHYWVDGVRYYGHTAYSNDKKTKGVDVCYLPNHPKIYTDGERIRRYRNKPRNKGKVYVSEKGSDRPQ